jgi:hypothetical protein
VPVFKHTDGNITKILDLIVDTGIDGLRPIDPMAGMDLGDVKQRYGDLWIWSEAAGGFVAPATDRLRWIGILGARRKREGSGG